jgi:cyanophycin synthetase
LQKGTSMIDLTKTGTSMMRMTLKMVCDELLGRGWRVERYATSSSQLRVTRPDGKVLEITSVTPPTMSHIAALRAEDKYITALILAEQGLPVPQTRRIWATNDAAITEAAEELLAVAPRLVVKPLDAAHGDGVTVGLTSVDGVRQAVAYAAAHADIALIQECIDPAIDIRISCIGNRMVAALERIPARVLGDGEHTLSQLIDITNAQENRGLNYNKELNQINKDLVTRYLGEDLLNTEVPAAGEYYQLLGTANVGTGGETRDVTDDVPAWLVAMAEKASAALDLPVCGIDFLLRAQPTADATQEQLGPVIIELNSSPALFIHETPTHGQSRPVIAAYADYLAAL